MPLPNMWWIVANDRDPEHGWHWKMYFSRPNDSRETFNWGGPNWIKSSTSIARVKEMRRGDLVAAYQASEGIVGFARLGSDGYMSDESGKFDTFDLASAPVVRLHIPIPLEVVKDQPSAKDDFEFVRIVKQGSVFRVSASGRDRLLSLSRQFNPSQASQLDELLESSSA
jgi:hypothetical protein